MNLFQFNERRSKIKNCYLEMDRVARELNNFDIINTINKSIENLEEDSFNMVIVGEFSRGKSTFINALLGKRILPSATKPTTTIINKISYGQEPKFILNFRESDEKKVIDEREFKDITAGIEPDYEDQDEVLEYNKSLEEISKISYADIKYPTEFCKAGVEIIDTPGTNDLDQAREEITFNFIPKSDIAILLLSANQILSQSEIGFLKDRILDNDIKKVFFVINFKDRLNSDEDKNKVINYAREHLKEVVEEPRIFMVSAKEALNYKRKNNGEVFKGKVPENFEGTGFLNLEKELMDYLINEKGNVKIKKYIDRAKRINLEIIKKDIDFKLNSVDLPVIELEKKLMIAKPQFERARLASKNVLAELRIKLYSLESDLVNKYKSGLELVAMEANMTINNYQGDVEADLIGKAIERTVAPIQKKVQQELEEYKQKYVDIEINKTLKKIQNIWIDMNINLNNLNNSKELVENEEFYLSNVNEETNNDNVAGLLAGGLVFAAFQFPFIVIPAAIFGGKIIAGFMEERRRQELLTKFKMQVDKRYGEIIPMQIGKFRDSYRKQIEGIISPLENQIEEKIKGLETQLNNLISEKKFKAMDVKREKDKLRELRENLMGINRILEGVKLN